VILRAAGERSASERATAAESHPFDEDHAASRGTRPEGLEPTVVLGVVPAPGLLDARELGHELARDAATIEWCLKSIGTGKMFWHVWVDLASAYAWRGQTAEAAAAVAEILKLRPGLTVRQMVEEAWANSDNATFRKEYERIAEGVRKAGLPER
jgi:hypothetical protein